VPTAVLVICAAGVVWTDPQPQQNAFALLAASPSSIEEAVALLDQEETIRSGLLNAYLAPRRYLSAEGEMDHISEIYEYALNMSPQQAGQVQHLYEQVARPILYKPVKQQAETESNRWQNQVFIEEPAQASDLYEQFFDEPITDGEKDTIVRAARSTWMPEQARAGWQAVDDREVYLARQETTVTAQGDWAEVEVYEVYENQTGQRQEVVYYFSLPETAVITGIWLGESADKSAAFSYQVTPRGAAQAVYQNEVRRNVDPALVEQIGPTQYRLRVFPILPQRWDWDEESNRSTLAESPPMHLWFTYRTMADAQTWPLPALADLRNVYWDDETVRLVNGVETAVSEEWLPSAIPATSPIAPVAHSTQFADGQVVQARPATEQDVPAIPADVNVAVVLDRSRSMAKIANQVAEALAQVDNLAGNVDVYLTATAHRGEDPSVLPLAELDVANLIYYGGQDAAELLTQFNDLYDEQPYNIILVLTDQTGFGVTEESVEIAVLEMPVWMVHIGGDFPLGYDDATLAAIQGSGGGVAATVDEALTRWLVKAEAAENDVMADLVDGYLWQTFATDTEAALTAVTGQAITHETTDDFAAMAARQVILTAMQRYREDLAALDLLDSLHALAKEQGIVTPYSSMIVLVNEQQEQLLNELEEQDDRFEREFEDVGETEGITVTGVPEPEEWLLLGLTFLLLIWYWAKSRRPSIPSTRT
jgi:putative PEP-CTERM system integral membrane protein